MAEDEAAFADEGQTVTEVPNDLVPAVRELIAKASQGILIHCRISIAATLCRANRSRCGIVLRRFCLIASVLMVGACATGGSDTPGMPWLIWATARSLAGAPPQPPDFYPEPVRVSDTLRFTDITAGGDHICALTLDRETYCWGANRYEQLGSAAVSETCGTGSGAFSCSPRPVRVEGTPPFTALEASRWTTCGLDVSGAAHCWGYGLGGRTENGFLAHRATPLAISGNHAFTALASSASSNGRFCGLTADGRAWCWGLAQRTDGTTGIFAGPEPVSANPTFASISYAGQHGCGIGENGSTYCWGNNDYGALGTGSSWHQGGIRESPTPIPVQRGSRFERVIAAGGYSCGLDTEGEALCWGLGFPVQATGPAYPRLSDDPLPHGAEPVRLDASGPPWTSLDASDTQICGIAMDGAVYCLRATPLQNAENGPIRIESDQIFVELAVGNGHACAIGADAFAYCWGDGSAGQVGRPPSGRR